MNLDTERVIKFSDKDTDVGRILEEAIKLNADIFAEEKIQKGVNTEADEDEKIKKYCKDNKVDYNDNEEYKKAVIAVAQ